MPPLTTPDLDPPPSRDRIIEELRDIPIEQLRENPHNPRTHYSMPELGQLTESLLLGQKVPLRVFPNGDGTFTILAGHRRKRAAVLGGIPTLKCIIVNPPASDDEGVIDQLAEHIQHEDYSPMDMADAIQKVLANGKVKLAAIAAKLGVTEGYVSKLLRISDDLAPELKALVRSGKLPISTAYPISRLPDHEDQKALADRFLSGELKRAGVEEEAQHLLKSAAPKKRSRTFAAHGIKLSLPGSLTGETLEQFIRELRKFFRGGDGPAGAMVPA